MAQTIQQIYDLVIAGGRKNDPRTKKEIDVQLKEAREAYKKLDKKKKPYFDKDRLKNPYADSRVIYGKMSTKVKTLFACIDAEVQEILLVNELNKQGEKIDLIFTHHPEGLALMDLTKVMPIQEAVMGDLGVPINVTEKLLDPRAKKIDRALHADNFNRVADAARLMEIPFMNCHTPADNYVHKYLEKFVKEKRSKMRYLKDLTEALLDIPEFAMGAKMNSAPVVVAGSPSSKLGKVAVTGMTGGTSGNEDIYEALNKAGVSTILAMHMSEAHREKAEKQYLNIIVTGHMSSDSLGMNLILDQLEKKKVKVISGGGLLRVKR
ncbi:NGG1p interacting factor NIF3 [Candidatus Peregrinibacteria bacterium]|mgnify:CR=1 FL=1|jgi:hypothetical protein|nr:NGG1p interacting factor NIF3 [Candidatus Peregrinibacteria bacterium]MBT7483743.1 NGG1p interacting factor NIF3 [Candidatus Peregrinibacteria bacterium]MBT7703205.1 NGG1p interacting factor NIF3 [Candidatus Peregrinibacteria bacterium]